MAEYNQNLLIASSSSLFFNTPRIDVTGLKEVWVEVEVTCTAPLLVCDFSICTILSLYSGRVLNMGAGGSSGVQICANQPGYSFSGGYYLQINDPPVGTSYFYVRMSNPGKLMGTYYTYASGGGDVRVVARAWGWGRATVG